MSANRHDNPLETRLTRLEEHHAFAERTVEQLGEEIVALHQRVDDAHARIASLELRLARLTETRDQPGDDPARSPDAPPEAPGDEQG